MTILSGIQPSGVLHLGNYLGALKQFIALQNEGHAYYCIVDLHAITVPQEPEQLRQNTLSLAAMYLAAGLDPQKSTLFVQSHVKEHAELGWILNTIATMGELERMTQFKDKTSGVKGQGSVTVGLFDYPVLMAADILLYQPHIVPVGEDQQQHVELTRELAKRFNHRFGETFRIPEVRLQKEGARIMGLDNPNKKMSKSASSPNNYIALTDDAETIKKKIAKAVTDSGTEVISGKDKPALTNLLTIMSVLSSKSIPQLEKHFAGKGYAAFKKELAETVIESLAPLQNEYQKLMGTPQTLKKILEDGAHRARSVATKTMEQAREKIGLLK
ncbi:tryptophan--tRNA ligase [Candidatus Uhrbacteria bacterium]|nr:tryptophan--tRNA ligase [Candidatus Uhrbacteria bacterium]